MITRDNKIHLIDFGVARFFRSVNQKKNNNINLIEFEKNTMMTPTGDFMIRAPEVMDGCDYNELIDVWSAGLLIYELLFGINPF